VIGGSGFHVDTGMLTAFVRWPTSDQDDAKEFHYTASSDELSFDATAMGTTVTVRMKRQ